MSQTKPQSGGRQAGEQAAARPQQVPPAALAGAVPVRPALAPTVQLVGEMQGTGFKDRQWLIQRDGQFLQLTELLYRVAEQVNGERTLEEIAAGVTESTEWLVSADNVRQLIGTKLMPLGLIATADGAVAPRGGMAGGNRGRSPLAVNLRMKVLGPRLIDPITRVLQVLYAPPVLLPLLSIIAIAHGWLYLAQGNGVIGGIRDVIYRPGLLLVVLAIMLAAGVFHEFGHAAALRYGGGRVRGMGVGLYLIYPVLYTDVTDSYRLGRWARVRTDLGGFYFYLVFALGILGAYALTGQEFLLLVVLLINLDIIRQNIPFVRLDGYWALADLTGIPDFFSQMGPFLRSVLRIPGWRGSRLPALKPWVKLVFALYIVLTLPVLALLLVVMIRSLPGFTATLWDSLLLQTEAFSRERAAGNGVGMTLTGVQVLFLALQLFGIAYLLYTLARPLLGALWRWSRPTPLRALAGGTVIAAAVALAAYFSAPQLSFLGGAAPSDVQRFEALGRTHVTEPVPYPQSPPVGGDHAPIWQNCGFYAMPVASENAVHSLEHGAVWITYQPDLPKREVDALRRQVRGRTYVLASPFPGQPAPVIASAWGRQLRLDSADDPRLGQFVRAFRLGDQAPERGGGCSGGVGEPE